MGSGRKDRRRPRVGQCGRVPLVVLLLFVAVFFLGYLGRRQSASPPTPVWVDPAALSFASLPEWCDPRWADALEDTVALHPPFQAGDPLALGALGDDLLALSFVRALPRIDVDEDSGLAIDLRLHRPVAAVPVRDAFLLVSRDGTLLAGRWSTPPRLDGAFLPVVGPMNDAYEFFGVARPGDWLAEPRHLDGVDVAVSMTEHLSIPERRRLGRIVIDAALAGETSPLEPGIRLDLEGQRRIGFGRAPGDPAPGELPAGSKWRSVVRALEDGIPDWAFFDVRWDRPDIALRETPRLAQLETEETGGFVASRKVASRNVASRKSASRKSASSKRRDVSAPARRASEPARGARVR